MILFCHTWIPRRLGGLLLAAVLLTMVGGCPPRGGPALAPPAPPRPEPLVLQTINDNYAAIAGALSSNRISIVADFVDDQGTGRHMDLAGSLLFAPPRNFRLDITHALRSVMRVGSNEQRFWLWIEPERDQLWWGYWSDIDPLEPVNVPLRPDNLLPAMGLAPLPGPESGLSLVRQMPVGDEPYDKLLYFARDGQRHWIQREYWLDRFPPYLPRVIVFREPAGTVAMRAELADYEPVGDSAFLLARSIRLTWPPPTSKPEARNRLAMRIGSARWRELSTRQQEQAFTLDEQRCPIPRERWVQVGRAASVSNDLLPADAVLESSPE